MSQSRRQPHRPRPRAASAAALAALLLVTSPAAAYQQLTGREGHPDFPAIPDALDLEISPEEWEEIQDGEIVVQIVERSDEDRQARAIGYLDAHPVWLFDIATDSTLAPELVAEVEEVVVLESYAATDAYPSGKKFRGIADFSWLLPTFEYTLVSAYENTGTAQCWAQLSGDFDKNEGTHTFLWDPVRKKTLGVFTFDFALRGILSLVPESLVLGLASRTLPGFMRDVDDMTVTMAGRDPGRARRVEARWQALRPRLEAGEFPERVWWGYPPEPPAGLPGPASPGRGGLLMPDDAPAPAAAPGAEGGEGGAPDVAAPAPGDPAPPPADG